MKPGQASRTAELVCMGRAMAHRRTKVEAFDDPTAIELLGDEARGRVERARSDAPPSGPRERAFRAYLKRQSAVMVARTVAIDDAIREASSPQVVILGAGLDGRAWRMDALRDVTVFEVDHPDSQRVKRERVGRLTQVARDVRFVPVDFERDKLFDALAAAAHDRELPTTWVWEGVVMYLRQSDIEATLDVLAKRSQRSSRVIVLYHYPTPLLWFAGLAVHYLGEPFRSRFTPEEMQAIIAKYGFARVSDRGISEIGQVLDPTELGAVTRRLRHLRLNVSDRG